MNISKQLNTTNHTIEITVHNLLSRAEKILGGTKSSVALVMVFSVVPGFLTGQGYAFLFISLPIFLTFVLIQKLGTIRVKGKNNNIHPENILRSARMVLIIFALIYGVIGLVKGQPEIAWSLFYTHALVSLWLYILYGT